MEASCGALLAEATIPEMNGGYSVDIGIKAKVLESAVHGTRSTVTASANDTASEPVATTALECPRLWLALTAGSRTVKATDMSCPSRLSTACRSPGKTRR